MWDNNIEPTSCHQNENQNIKNTVANHEFPNQFQYHTIYSTTIKILPSVAIKTKPNPKLEDIISPITNHTITVPSL